MKRITYIILIPLLLAITQSVALAEKVELNIDQTIKMAIKASEDYAIKDNQINQLHEKYVQVRSEIFPQVSTTGAWTHNTAYPESSEIKDYDGSMDISGSQLLWAFGRVKSAIKAAEHAVTITHLNKAATQEEVIANAKQAYFAALLAENSLKIIKSSYENAVANKKILEERSATGRVSKRDNIKISADVASRIPQLSNAKATLQSTHNTLKVIVGLTTDKKITLSDTFMSHYGKLHIETLRTKLMEDEPTLNALKETINLRKEIIQQQKATNYPTISLLGSYSYKGSANNASIGNENLNSYGFVGIKMSVPIFTGWKTDAAIKEAILVHDEARLQFNKQQEQLLLQLENAVADYHTLIETLKANNNAVDLAEQSYKLSTELFKSGQISVTDLNDAELQLTNQKLAKEKTLFDLNNKLALIEKLT